MMYQRTDLTLSMFYASSADADGNKVATLTGRMLARGLRWAAMVKRAT